MPKHSILNEKPKFEYHEIAPEIDKMEFQKVIDSRRSVRIYKDEDIPDEIIEKCIENGLMAPNSSNLQPWEFYYIKKSELRNKINHACLNQIAARKAPVLIIAVAHINTWKKHANKILEIFNKSNDVPKSAIDYYKKIVPFVYNQGPFSIFGFIKRILYSLRGIKKPIIREPVSKSHMKVWAVKSTALACGNIMLSLRAYGYDSCPMEGFDSKRLKKLLNLSKDSIIAMVISAGKRDKGGIYGPRLRFDKKDFIKKL